MAIKSGVNVDGVNVPNATGSIYAPPAAVNRSTITSAVFHNSSGGSLTLNVWLVPSGGSPDATNKVIQKAIAANESYTAPELIGQTVENGGSLQADDDGGGGTGLSYVSTVTEFTGSS